MHIKIIILVLIFIIVHTLLKKHLNLNILIFFIKITDQV